MIACHYTNSQNLWISFGVCWFLCKNLFNFVPPAWKLDDPYYHNEDPQEEFCQNQEDTAFEDPLENSSQNLSENNDLLLENFSTSASSSKNRKITKIPSQITGLEVDCDTCGKTFRNKYSLNSHVKEVHLTSAGGKKAKTLKKRESIVKNFEAFLEESNMEPLATLITNLQDLEIGLCNFFQSLHVKDQSNNVKKLPSLATAQAMRSHLKSMILQLSEGVKKLYILSCL